MADQSIPNTRGGQYYGQFTGGAVETLVYTGGGRLCKVVTITAGTAATSIYDGTQSTGGTLIYTSITNDVAGTIKELDISVTNGIVVKGTTGSMGCIATYNKTASLGL